MQIWVKVRKIYFAFNFVQILDPFLYLFMLKILSSKDLILLNSSELNVNFFRTYWVYPVLKIIKFEFWWSYT